MASRGYDGEVRAFAIPPITLAQWSVLGAGIMVLILLVVGGYLFWG
jgi:hypothetical protein